MAVKAALGLGKKQCNIVVFDWLVDSINKATKRNSGIPARDYSLDLTIQRIQHTRTEQLKYCEKFEDCVRASMELARSCKFPSQLENDVN